MGALKMRHRRGQKCRGGKCETEKLSTRNAGPRNARKTNKPRATCVVNVVTKMKYGFKATTACKNT